MVTPSHTAKSHQQTGWFPSWRALLSLCWRLSILLVFFFGALVSVLLSWWWTALGCIVGFIIAAILIRRVSTVDPETSSDDPIVFL